MFNVISDTDTKSNVMMIHFSGDVFDILGFLDKFSLIAFFIPISCWKYSVHTGDSA